MAIDGSNFYYKLIQVDHFILSHPLVKQSLHFWDDALLEQIADVILKTPHLIQAIAIDLQYCSSNDVVLSVHSQVRIR
jgi:hypothetical protein